MAVTAPGCRSCWTRTPTEHGGPASLQAATFTWGNPYYTKVTLATIGDAPPDVAVSHLTREKNLARADLLTEITDDMLALVGLTPSDFNPKAWETQKVDGKSYAIPLDTHPFVLYYNVDVCEKAGLLNSDGTLKEIKGTDGWEEALQAAKEVTGAYGASVPRSASSPRRGGCSRRSTPSGTATRRGWPTAGRSSPTTRS